MENKFIGKHGGRKCKCIQAYKAQACGNKTERFIQA